MKYMGYFGILQHLSLVQDGVPSAYRWWLNSGETSKLSIYHYLLYPSYFFQGFHTNFWVAQSFGHQAIRYEDFARLFGPHFALQALRFRVHLAKTSRTIPATRSRHPWTWDTTRGSFSQSLWNLLNTKSTQKRSFVSNTSFWHILMYMMYQTQKCSDIYIYMI